MVIAYESILGSDLDVAELRISSSPASPD